MIYSCFNEQIGHYDYFEDDKTIPINGDLPIPSPASRAGKSGSPARESGRRLPLSARKVGSGWHARGMVVQCSGMFSGLGEVETKNLVIGVAGAVIVGTAVYLLFGTYLKYATEKL